MATAAANGTIQKARIEVSLDQLTIGDLDTLESFASGSTKPGEITELLDRCVMGGARQLPLTAIADIVKALGEAISEMADPN